MGRAWAGHGRGKGMATASPIFATFILQWAGVGQGMGRGKYSHRLPLYEPINLTDYCDILSQTKKKGGRGMAGRAQDIATTRHPHSEGMGRGCHHSSYY